MSLAMKIVVRYRSTVIFITTLFPYQQFVALRRPVEPHPDKDFSLSDRLCQIELERAHFREFRPPLNIRGLLFPRV